MHIEHMKEYSGWTMTEQIPLLFHLSTYLKGRDRELDKEKICWFNSSNVHNSQGWAGSQPLEPSPAHQGAH